MDIPVNHPGFEGRGLAVRTAGFWSGGTIVLDGSRQPSKKGKFLLRDNTGREVAARLKSNGIDPVPKLEIGGSLVELARPLRWYEYAWMGLPVVLVFAGGALGALIGLGATYANARILRSERSTGARYGITAMISVSSAIVFLVLAAVFQVFVRGGA
jgi:hypothetical protein